MVSLFALFSSLLAGKRGEEFPKGVLTLTDFAEYLMLQTTSALGLSLRSLALYSDICFLEEGQTDEEHLRDLQDLGIGPKVVHHINGGLIMAILKDPERSVLRLIADKLREGYALRLFHPIPQTFEEIGKDVTECNKHNVMLINELQKELGWTAAEMWRHLIFNNTTTSPGAEGNHSKIEQREILRVHTNTDGGFHLPYRVIRPSEESIEQAMTEVLEDFKNRYGFSVTGTRLKAPDGASGDEQYASSRYTSRQMMDLLRRRLSGPLPKKLRLRRLASKLCRRIRRELREETIDAKYLMVPDLSGLFVDISVNGVILDTDEFIGRGLKRGYHVLGITRQCSRLTDGEGAQWCGNMQLLEGMLLKPEDKKRGIPALYATASFIEKVVTTTQAYMQCQYKFHGLTGMNSVDLGAFYNMATGAWEIVVFEVNPRLTNGTTLCELMWQVDTALRERDIPVPAEFTGALIIMKVPQDKPLDYQGQIAALGDDFLSADYANLGAMPIVVNTWDTEGQVVYSFFASNPQELHKLIQRVWEKLGAIGESDSAMLIES